ncbi:MAG: efflux RND transporter periplasmic adaptor subunit [Lachnospiraceae bacterium]|nr:efflux RND transporter periplasmic adaptor subunit [Lachnospiraceae bacterium]
MAVGLACAVSTAFLCGCAAELSGIGEKSSDEGAQTEEEERLDVSVANPELKDISISSNFSGTVIAESEVNVIPLLSGEVVEKNFEVGDHVNEGDLLFKIDDEALQIAVKQAEASLTSAQAGLSTTQASAEATKAQSNATRASATKSVGEIPYNAESMNVAVDSSYVTKRTANNSLKNAEDAVEQSEDALDDYKDARDAARSARDTAEQAFKATDPSSPDYESKKAAYESAQEVYEAAKSRVESAEYSLDSAKRSADNAEMQYELSRENYNLSQMQRDNYNTYTVPTTLYGAYASAVGADASDISADNSITSSAATVKSAQAGLDSAKLNLEHTNVKAPVSGTVTAINVTLHNMATQTTPAYTIQSDEPNKIVFYAAEETAKNIRPGSDAVVTKNGVDYNARIITVYDTIDASTGLFKIEASVTGNASDLISGSSVSVKTVTIRSDNALSVPIDSVYYDGDQAFVYVAEGDLAKKVDVVTGLTDETSIEILEGLSSDDKVIVTWSGSLRDGTLINATDVSKASSGGAPNTGETPAKLSAGAGDEE